MLPLRIDCQFASPWCPQAMGMHLDGLIAWTMVEEARAQRTQEPDYDSILARLPLQKHESGVWCASMFSVVNFAGQERRYLTAKTPVEQMARMIGRNVVDKAGGSTIDTVRGPAKNGQAYITVEYAQGLRAWCIGDAERITDLLSGVMAIGVKSRIGLGALMPYEDGQLWQIREDKQAEELWKRRSAPIRLTEDAQPAIGSSHPPYWRGTELVWRPRVNRLVEPVLGGGS